MYEICEHTADLGVRVHAATFETLVADAARGLFAVIAGHDAEIHPRVEETFTVAGTDPAWLLFDWLAELLAAFDLRRMLFCEFDVAVDAEGLRARARGERYDPARHALANEVKAVTQHELAAAPTPSGWEAFFILDI